MPATLIRLPMKSLSARWTVICGQIWMKITRHSRRGKDFSSYIACEFQDDVVGSSFVTGVVFDCRSDGSRQERFFICVGTLPENCFVENGEAMEIPALRRFLKQNYVKAEIYDTQKEYRRNMLSRWNVHNEQVLRMMKKGGILPPYRGYPEIHYREHLRHTGEA